MLNIRTMLTRNYWKWLGILLLMELITAKTVTRHEIITKSNGDKIERTWTKNDSEEAEEFDQAQPFPNLTPIVQENGFDWSELQKKLETFGKSEITQKQTSFKNPAIKEELLTTKEPIVRTFVDPDDGLKHTTTYFMTPAGSFGYGTKTEMVPTVSISTSKVPIASVLRDQYPTQPKWHNPEDFDTDDTHFESSSSVTEWQTQNIQQTGHHFVSSTRPINWSQANQIFGDLASNAAKDKNASKTPLEKVPPANRAHITWNTEPKQYFSSSSSFSGRTDSWTPQLNWLHHTSNPDDPQLSLPETTTIKADSNEKTLIPAKYPGMSIDQLISELFATTTAEPTTNTRPITTISVDDLPITEILHNGKPVDESFLNTLPDFLRPAVENVRNNKRKTIKFDNIPLTEREDAPSTTPPTIIITPTTKSAKLPEKAFSTSTQSSKTDWPGIKYHDPFASDEDTTSTASKRIPIPIELETPPPLIIVPPTPFSVNSLNKARGRDGVISSTINNNPKQSNILNFLRKLGLSIDDVKSQNGQTLTTTIVDDDGSILTASFMLSSVKGLEDSKKTETKVEKKPLK